MASTLSIEKVKKKKHKLTNTIILGIKNLNSNQIRTHLKKNWWYSEGRRKRNKVFNEKKSCEKGLKNVLFLLKKLTKTVAENVSESSESLHKKLRERNKSYSWSRKCDRLNPLNLNFLVSASSNQRNRKIIIFLEKENRWQRDSFGGEKNSKKEERAKKRKYE